MYRNKPRLNDYFSKVLTKKIFKIRGEKKVLDKR